MNAPHIVPGEMRLWTDRHPGAPRPAAGGPVLAGLLADVLGTTPGRVLVAGPHADDVLTLVAGRDATVLLRSLDDAEDVAARFPDVEVVCGDAVRYLADRAERGTATWDLVVALDGVERLTSNDFDHVPWADRFTRVAGAVAPEGRLLATIENPLSLLALADARPVSERRDTGDWDPPAHLDASRPRTLAAATALLAEAGLTGTTYAAGWLPTRPGVLVDQAADADDPRLRSALVRDLAALDDIALLLDPAGVGLEHVRAGRFADVAGGWLVVVDCGPGSGELPAAVLRASGDAASTFDTAAWALRPAGALVSEEAVRLAQSEDLVGLRTLVAAFLTWASERPAPVPADGVLVDAGFFTALDGPSLSAAVDPLAGTALWLARRLLAADMRRIWPPWLGETGVARSLIAMTGRSADAADVDAVADLLNSPVVTDDLRSMRAVNEQLRRDLEAAQGRIAAYDRLAANRDRQLEKRSNRIHAAELRAANAERSGGAVTGRGSLRRNMGRVARGLRHPKRAAAAVRGRLSGS